MSDHLIKRSEALANSFETVYHFPIELAYGTDRTLEQEITFKQKMQRAIALQINIVEAHVQIEMLTQELQKERNKTIMQRIKEKLNW